MPRFTIVTICRNEEKNIADTIQSVLNQNFTDYEYIVQDGKSTDRTVEIANSFVEQFKQKNISYKVYSEQDAGIYNAMNKAIDKASGEIINFINSGDRIDNAGVLDKVNSSFTNDIDILYGMTNNNVPNDLDKIIVSMVFGHPGAFIKSTIMKEYKYNENYKIVSDYEFFLQCYLNNKKFKYVQEQFAIFNYDGISCSSPLITYKELYSIKTRYHLKKDSKLVYYIKILLYPVKTSYNNFKKYLKQRKNNK